MTGRFHSILSSLILLLIKVCCQENERFNRNPIGPFADRQFPFVARINVRPSSTASSTSTQICTATLVSPQWILTAAHCVVDEGNRFRNGPLVETQLGFHNLSQLGLQVIDSSSGIFTHPLYNGTTRDFDFALIRLKEKAVLNSYVNFISLPTVEDCRRSQFAYASQQIYPSELCSNPSSIGWGETDQAALYKNILQTADLTTEPYSQCQKLNPLAASFSKAKLCTSGLRNRMACQLDSGSPLFCQLGSRQVLIGINSYGSSVCQQQLAKNIVFSRICQALNWIRFYTSNESNCPEISAPAMNGRVVTIVAGLQRRLICNPGYQFKGRVELSSCQGSQWSPIDGACIQSLSARDGDTFEKLLISVEKNDTTVVRPLTTNSTFTKLIKDGDVWATFFGRNPIHAAAKTDALEALVLIWPFVQNLIEQYDRVDGLTAVHLACRNDARRVLEFLVGQNASAINFRDRKYGRLPLHIAAADGRLQVVEYLVERAGANVTDRANEQFWSDTPLHLAALEGRNDVVKYFLNINRSLANLGDSKGAWPLQRAVARGHISTVQTFLEFLPSLNLSQVRQTGRNRTLLHAAARFGKLDMTIYLVEKKQCDIFARSNLADDRLMPVHLAAKYGRFAVVKYYIQRAPGIIEMKTAADETIFQLASRSTVNESKQMLKWLQETGNL